MVQRSDRFADDCLQLELPLAEPPRTKRPRHAFAGFPRLVVDNSNDRSVDLVETRQLTLPFDLPISQRRLECFVPLAKYRYLNYGLLDLLGNVPDVRRSLQRLERLGVWIIGDLVLCSPGAIRQAIGRNDLALAGIRAGLAELGLELGMSLPSWHRPHDFCRVAG
ncbi:MAG: hypothetical protein Q8R02_08910 [Hyphomonadaceae bacterium]|nr:hypothetical protein [Hyphomonadaceae bacterium]